MSDFMRSIPITPDMVSLWVPNGLTTGIDLIRSNRGRCFGTHPNVPVISPPIEQISDCDATAGWAGTALTTDTADKKEGTGSLVDTVATPTDTTWYHTDYDPTGTWDLSGKKHMLFWLKSDRASTDFTFARVFIYEGVNWRRWDLTFSAGVWTQMKELLSTGDAESGTPPDITSIDYVRVSFHTADTTAFYKKIDDLRVTAKPSLINPSVGWHFDGTNDYITLGNDGSLNVADATFGAWVYLTDATESVFFSKLGSANYGYIIGTNAADKLTAAVGNGSSFEASVASAALPEDSWSFVAVTFAQTGTADTVVKIYENCSIVGQATETHWVSHGSYDNQLGRWHEASLMDGYIALPFIVNKAWSAAQVSNFYNATKGMFAPRG